MDEARYREAERRYHAAMGVAPSEHRVRLPRLGAQVRVQEVGDGPPVLFLHGSPNSGSTWAGLVARLAGFRCLLLDRPGTGLSDPLPHPVTPADLRRMAERLPVDVLDALGIERAHVVASSFGGMIALYAAAAAPDRFDRMVQMSCPAFVPGMGIPAFLRLAMVPGLGRLLVSLPPSARGNAMMLRQIGHGASLDAGRIPRAFHDWYLELGRHTDTLSESAAASRFGTVRGFRPDVTIPDQVLGAVTTPTHFLWGADDGYGGVETAERVVGAMPDATLEVVPSAGHLPWLDDPDLAARAVTGHLRTTDRTTPGSPVGTSPHA